MSSTNNEKTVSKDTPEIFMELSVKHMQQIINLVDTSKKEELKAIVIKMGAEWCGPCQKIKPLVLSCIKHMPPNVICFDIDADDNMELYSFFKNKRLINGIPAILCYTQNNERDPEKWYIPDMSVLGSDQNQIKHLFKTIFES